MGEVITDPFEQLLQIAFGNPLGLSNARRRKFGIVEPALDGLANPVQDRGLGRGVTRVRGRGRKLMVSDSSVRAVASSIREKTSASPPGAITRASPNFNLPVMRP